MESMKVFVQYEIPRGVVESIRVFVQYENLAFLKESLTLTEFTV